MDTRSKILSPEAAARVARDRDIPILAGYFDPLLAEHARRIVEVAQGRPLLALVLDYPEAILPAAARAELLAALRPVSYVSVVDRSGLDSLFEDVSVTCEDEADLARQKQLLEHIRSREPKTA